MRKSFLLEERTPGVERWLPTNGHFYPDYDALLDYADRRSRTSGITQVRILEIEHTKPVIVKIIGEESK